MVTSIRATAAFVLLSILALSSTWTATVQAHSSSWPTITRSEHILDLQHDVLPRDATTLKLVKRSNTQPALAAQDGVSRHDTVRLSFSAFNTTFHLYLEPNHDFIHPEANLGEDVDLEEIKAFRGVVIQDQYHSDRKWNRAMTTSRMEKRTIEHMFHEEGVQGWARMMIEHDDNPVNRGADRLNNGLVLRGAFMVGEDVYHVNTGQHYRVQKRSDDATPSSFSSSQSSLVIYRDSDLYNTPAMLKKRRSDDQGKPQGQQQSCGTHSLVNQEPFNTDAFEYYYPPNRTLTLPVSGYGGNLDLSSSWSDVLKAPLSKRQVAVKVAGPNPVPQGCPVDRLVNYMGVAADCTYVSNYGGPALARKQIFADFNTASGIYESTFNVALGVISLNITSSDCPTTPVKGMEWNQECSAAYTIDKRLSDFSFWRGQDGKSSDGAGLWHLMTKCNSGAIVGIAWTKTLCQMKTSEQGKGSGLQYTAGTGISSVTPNEWMVVAHEIGHGFGAIHDCTSQLCPNPNGQCCPLSATTCDAGAQFIMNPSEQVATKVFSPCSISAICDTIQSASGQCLQPPGTKTTVSTQPNICGNGLKEAGEECDCGSADDCAQDPCCDGTTCKLKGTAVCDDLNDGCCLNCQLRPAGQVCRQAISECDVQEVCTGTNATCPPDVRLENETPCKGTGNVTGLQCANGVCTSRDLQCQQQDQAGVTKACGASSSCDLLCNDPSGNSLSCMQVPGTYFIDGTPCGFGGACSQGDCKYSSGIKGVLNWARNHLAIVIPVGCLIGLILLCCIWSCCCARCLDNRRQRRMMVQKPPGAGPLRGGTYTYGGARAVTSNPNGAGPYSPPPYGVEVVHGASHGAQQHSYPMQSLSPPPPIYYDPAVMSRSREEDELQRAMEESRLEQERDQQRRSNGYRNSHATYSSPSSPLLRGSPPSPSPSQQPTSRNGAGVAFTPLLGADSPDYSRRENKQNQHSDRSADRGSSQANSGSTRGRGNGDGKNEGGYSPSGYI
ncbi:hypothetical protein EMPS_01503 [Entomortierella parvispora]|uniref:Disintegrin domain-containing protein n=1 Tax=Entomortierella parvispora TaxID=205924 RepID=A0A9P3LSV4_9FUNG|nr:hypothetical protein EMPS_01503 [Entomortierella parvispora]